MSVPKIYHVKCPKCDTNHLTNELIWKQIECVECGFEIKQTWKEANEAYKREYPDPKLRELVKELNDIILNQAMSDIKRDY